MRPVPERPVLTRGHEEDAAPGRSPESGRGAAGIVQQAARLAVRLSLRLTGDRFRRLAQAGRERDQTYGSAVNVAARSGSSAAGRARMASTTAAFASVTRRPRSAKLASARRVPIPGPGAIVLGPQRRLVERRQSLTAGWAVVEPAAPVGRGRRSSSPAPFPPEIKRFSTRPLRFRRRQGYLRRGWCRPLRG